MCSAAKLPMPRVQSTRPVEHEQSQNGIATRKRSLLNLRAWTPSISKIGTKPGGSQTPVKIFEAWSKFPSHTRVDRNGPAGELDDMIGRDFLPSTEASPIVGQHELEPKAGVAPKWLPLLMQKTLRRGKSKSMNLRGLTTASPAEQARRNRKGLAGKWKRLYRSSSSDLRKYALYRGHRSSISLGDTLEYPELECLPGDTLLTEKHLRRLQSSLEVRDEKSASQNAANRLSYPGSTQSRGLPRTQAVDWGKVYASCVGSISALQSEAKLDIVSNSTDKPQDDVRSMDLRESTVDFQKALGREQEKVKDRLMEKLANMVGEERKVELPRDSADFKRLSVASKSTVDTARASSIKTKDLKIPGSFG